MRNRRWQIGVLAVAVASLALVGCGDTIIGGDQVTNNIVLPGVNGSGGETPGGGGGASCPANGVIDSIRVNPFGYSCPAGTTTPNNGSGLLPVGCVAVITATPKDAAGNDVPANVHGPNVQWATAIGASVIQVDAHDENPFNKRVSLRSGVTSGEFQVTATVCNKTGAWNGRVGNVQ